MEYHARILLVDSMNLVEGNLQPQILNRFGLRVLVRRFTDTEEQFGVYCLAVNSTNNPEFPYITYADAPIALADEISPFEASKPHCVFDERLSLEKSNNETVSLLSLRIRPNKSLSALIVQMEHDETNVNGMFNPEGADGS